MCEASVQTEEEDIKPILQKRKHSPDLAVQYDDPLEPQEKKAKQAKFVIVNMRQDGVDVKEEVADESIFIRTDSENIDHVVSKIADSHNKNKNRNKKKNKRRQETYYEDDVKEEATDDNDGDDDYFPDTSKGHGRNRTKTETPEAQNGNYDSDIKPYNCSHCPEKYGKLYGLAMHMLCIHDIGEDGKHPCPVCPFNALKMTGLKQHIEEYHQMADGNPPPNPPSLDELYTPRKYNTGGRKERVVLEEPRQADSVPMHKCSHCSAEVKGMIALVRHLADDHKIGTHGKRVCPGCSFTSEYIVFIG